MHNKIMKYLKKTHKNQMLSELQKTISNKLFKKITFIYKQ